MKLLFVFNNQTSLSGNDAAIKTLKDNSCEDDIHCEEILLAIEGLIPYNEAVSFLGLSDIFVSSLELLQNSSLGVKAKNISDTLHAIQQASEKQSKQIFEFQSNYIHNFGKG